MQEDLVESLAEKHPIAPLLLDTRLHPLVSRQNLHASITAMRIGLSRPRAACHLLLLRPYL